MRKLICHFQTALKLPSHSYWNWALCLPAISAGTSTIYHRPSSIARTPVFVIARLSSTDCARDKSARFSSLLEFCVRFRNPRLRHRAMCFFFLSGGAASRLIASRRSRRIEIIERMRAIICEMIDLDALRFYTLMSLDVVTFPFIDISTILLNAREEPREKISRWINWKEKRLLPR